MGIGDQIMAAGRAKLLHLKTGRKVCIGKLNRPPYWSPLYEGIKYLCKDHRDPEAVWLHDYPGSRPYIDYEATLSHPDNENCPHKKWVRWVFKPYSPSPMDVVFTEQELKEVDNHKGLFPYIIVAPAVKRNAPPLKQWPWKYWEVVVKYLAATYPGLNMYQLTVGLERILPGCIEVKTDLRQTAVWLSGAKALVCNEGMFHHLAAALNVPTVVIHGIFIPPSATGYIFQRSVFKKTPYEGWRTNHPIGEKALELIPPGEVIKPLRRILDA